jgi:hypothetical protein
MLRARKTRSWQYNLKLPSAQARLAKGEGAVYGALNSRDVRGIDVEHLIQTIGDRYLHADVSCNASMIDWSFSPSQKRMMYYVLSKFVRQDPCRLSSGKAREHFRVADVYASLVVILCASNLPGAVGEPSGRFDCHYRQGVFRDQ